MQKTTINTTVNAIQIPANLVWVIALFFVGFGLGSYAILDNNEGLYAEIAREMLHSGDWRQWVIPHLNGLAYMEKPPLLYLLTAMSFSIFGESEWSARLVPALSSLSCVGLMLWFGEKIGRVQAARLAAVMFVSGLGVTLMSRTLMFDMLLTALLCGALMHAYLFVMHRDPRALRWSLGFLGFALLAKGFVAVVLYCAVAGTFVLVQSTSVRDFLQRLFAWLDVRALLVFFLIAAPWHVLASLTEPIFAWFYFINEHVLRFLGKREPHDYYAGAWWYYLPRMVIYLFPWSFLLLGMAFAKRTVSVDKPLQWFLGLAWLMPVLFFSVSSAKANYYLVTVMPFAALQLAIALEDRQYGSVWGRVLPSFGLLGLFAVLVLAALKSRVVLSAVTVMGLSGDQFVLLALIAAVSVIGLSILCVWLAPKMSVLSYLALPVICLVSLLSILHAAPELGSSKPVAELVQQRYADRRVVLFKTFEEKSSLTFYLKSTVNVVDSRSADLYWGNRLHQNTMLLSDAQLMAQLTGQMPTKPMVLLVLDKDLEAFQSKPYFSQFKLGQKMEKLALFVN